MAFSGSMVGAFYAGIIYKRYKSIQGALIGEVIGTGILGALVAYPISALILGRETATLVYIIPFCLSAFGGGIMAYCIMKIPNI